MNKAVFLDRDGTINVEKEYLYRIEDFEFLPGAVEGMRLLQKAGFVLIIVTNQSGIARGYYTENDFCHLNNWMLDELKDLGVIISSVYYCPHHPEAIMEKYKVECECRKPALGLYRKAIKDFCIDINYSFAIGDKIRDCSICGESSCKGFLIEKSEDSKIIELVKEGRYSNVRYSSSLYEAARIIVEEQR